MKQKVLAFACGAMTVALGFSIVERRDSSAQAAVPNKIAAKAYSPPFGEWVLVYLKNFVANKRLDLTIDADYAVESGSTKFVVTITSSDKDRAAKFTQLVKGVVESRVKMWRAEGQEISLNDFEFVAKTE